MRQDFGFENVKRRTFAVRVRDAIAEAIEGFRDGRRVRFCMANCVIVGANADDTPFLEFDEYGGIVEVRFIGIEMKGPKVNPNAPTEGFGKSRPYLMRPAAKQP